MSKSKESAAAAAVDMVQNGMTLGLGSGSTAEIFIEFLGSRVKSGLQVRGVPTSKASEQCAIENGVPLIEPDKVERIQLTVDGADEVDRQFQLIKGGGACLLREKIIADSSEQMVVIVDQSKIVDTLGSFPLPIEVDPFAVALTAERIYTALIHAGCEDASTVLRQNRKKTGPLITDGGHYILDSECKKIPDPRTTARLLNSIPGVIEHGLFIDLATTIIVGEDDSAKIMEIVRE